MTTNHARRLARLEGTIHTCVTCRPWHEDKQVRIIRPEDRHTLPVIPAMCPNCGKPTPTRIRAIVIARDDRGHHPTDAKETA